MTEQDLKRSLNLVRYGGIVVTVVAFVAMLGVFLMLGNALGETGDVLNQALPYILLITLITAVLAVVFYFGYAMYLRRRMNR